MSSKFHHERSAVIMMGLVIRVFLVFYGMYLRCSFLTLSSSRYNDENYKIPVLVLNSAINPLAYAFFKRGSHKLNKKFLNKANQVKPSHVCVWLIFNTVGLNINWSRIKRGTRLELANMWPFQTPAELKFGNMVFRKGARPIGQCAKIWFLSWLWPVN